MTRWTTRKPSQPGWYWWRREGADAEILNVTADKLNGNTYTWRLFSDGQWSDAPIEEPHEEST